MDKQTRPSQVPSASSPAAQRRMQATRGQNTAPEMALRRELYQRGLRYRIQVAVIPGLRRTADLAFIKQRIAVFVDGCFWHGCPTHGTQSRSNPEFWAEKIRANVARDADTNRRLSDSGWTVVRVWAHESPQEAADRIKQYFA